MLTQVTSIKEEKLAISFMEVNGIYKLGKVEKLISTDSNGWSQ